MGKLNEGFLDDIAADAGGTTQVIDLTSTTGRFNDNGEPQDLDDIINNSPSQNQLATASTGTIVIPEALSDKIQEMEDTIIEDSKNKKRKEKKVAEATETVKKKGRTKKMAAAVAQEIVRTAEPQALDSDTYGDIVKIQQQRILQKSNEQITPDEYQEVKQVIEENNNVTLEPQEVVEVVEEVGEALAEMPDGDEIDLEDIQVKKVEKAGKFKTVVNIKPNLIPSIINKIASAVKKETSGAIDARLADFVRVIKNANKNQLKNSAIKLCSRTITLKPTKSGGITVRKYNRILIGVLDNFESTGNIVVFMQDSRDKFIQEVEKSKFQSEEAFMSFIKNVVISFYYEGFDVTARKLELNGNSSPLIEIATLIIKTGNYQVKTKKNDAGYVTAINIISKGTVREWLSVSIIEDTVNGGYHIYAINNTTRDKFSLHSDKKTVTYQGLQNRILSVLGKLYDPKETQWDKTFGVTEEDSVYYMINKIKHVKLRQAFMQMWSEAEDHPELGIELQKVLSVKEYAQLIKKDDYDAESIGGKTAKCDAFFLTYLAYQIIGGDKRAGRQYITTDQYYQKYSVKDRRNYQQRERTILRKEPSQRNYNARPYIFQLEYQVDGKTYVCKASTFKEILELTHFLENPVKNPVSPIK